VLRFRDGREEISQRRGTRRGVGEVRTEPELFSGAADVEREGEQTDFTLPVAAVTLKRSWWLTPQTTK